MKKRKRKVTSMDIKQTREKFSEAISDIKTNFKPDDGTIGVKKLQSMFVNLWKSGNNGKVAVGVSCFAVLLVLFLIWPKSLDSEYKRLQCELYETEEKISNIASLLGEENKDDFDSVLSREQVEAIKKQFKEGVPELFRGLDASKKKEVIAELKNNLDKKKKELKQSKIKYSEYESAEGCRQNLRQLGAAVDMARESGKQITKIDDSLLKWLKKVPTKCPEGGAPYAIDENGKVICTSGKGWHVLK